MTQISLVQWTHILIPKPVPASDPTEISSRYEILAAFDRVHNAVTPAYWVKIGVF